ncbi:MAG: type III-B CRISPR module RAMP protein Cmr1 [Planctomycetes bacterium]|nr:type III-B CRISPR module RAMP protein Cmr1 [Planctomycetota bacterium]
MTAPTRYELQMSFVTPCFLKGVSDDTPELRAPSVRGMLRWWLRAMLGGRRDLKGIQKIESSLFGESAGDSGRQGKVFVRVEQSAGPVIRRGTSPPDCQQDYTIRETSQGKDVRQNPIVYLGYGPYSYERGRGNITTRGAFAAGTSFAVHFLVRQRLTDGEGNALASAVWGLTRLGALGSRSRRGFGSVVLEPGGGADALFEELPSEDFRAAIPTPGLRSQLLDGAALSPEFTALGGNTGLFRGPFHAKWQDALGWLGKAWKDCRNDIRDRHGDKHRGNVRALLGMPLQVAKQSGQKPSPVELGKVERRASPFLLRVSREGGKYIPLILAVPGVFHPEEQGKQADFERVFDEALAFFKKREGVCQIWK